MNKSKHLTLMHVVTQNSSNIASDMNGEKVMLNIPNGRYYNLGTVGGTIWDHLSSPVTVEELINRLIEEFQVEASVCEDQTLTFLDSLLEEGLIVAAETGKTA